MKRIIFCIFVFLSSSLLSAQELVITAGGDVNFNAFGRPPHPREAIASTERNTFRHYLSGIAHLVDGDLNFANIETVVSDERLPMRQVQFPFVSHSESIREMIRTGFNLFSLANNHSADAGYRGLESTLSHFERFRRDQFVVYHGIARDSVELAAKPKIFGFKGKKIAFSAIGISNPNFEPRRNQAGILNFRNPQHFDLVIEELRHADVDFRILSIHYGREGQVNLDPGQKRLFERAVDLGKVDLLLGHHPHVVRPVQRYRDAVIFYSLGNYVMLGAADTRGRGVGRDYGLLARVVLSVNPLTQKFQYEAIQATPLTNVHRRAEPLVGKALRDRIAFLNNLSERELGRDAVLFSSDENLGLGIRCEFGNSEAEYFSERARNDCFLANRLR